MRLTDRPRALAEVRPEVAWPAALQRTVDLALARDTADRYQSAAQFGREFAAACSELPTSGAADAQTKVLAGAGLPATRVARPDAAASAATSPGAASPDRSRTPLVVGALAGLAAVAALVWKLGLAGTGAATTNPADTTARPATPVAPALETRTAAPTGDVQLYARNGTDVPSPGAVTPSSAPSATPPRSAPAGRPATPTSGGGSATPTTPPATPSTTPSAGSTTVGTPPAATEVNAQLSTLLREAQSGAGARVLRELAALQPRLAGQPLAESYYVQMIAYTALEDPDGVCAAAKQVITRHETAARVQLARRASELMQCDSEATP